MNKYFIKLYLLRISGDSSENGAYIWWNLNIRRTHDSASLWLISKRSRVCFRVLNKPVNLIYFCFLFFF